MVTSVTNHPSTLSPLLNSRSAITNSIEMMPSWNITEAIVRAMLYGKNTFQ